MVRLIPDDGYTPNFRLVFNHFMMDSESLRPYLDWYKANFASIFAKHEAYKWESVQTFQTSYLPDKEHYPAILKESFRKSANLLNSRSVFSLGMMLDISRFSLAHPEISPSGLDLFYDLFEETSKADTEDALLDSISSFRQHIRSFVRANMSDKKNDYQDLHAVSVYLNHRYPDTFFMYRAYEFTQFNKLIDNEFEYKWGADANYLAYLDMCNDLNAILRRELALDEGFRLAVHNAIHSDKKYYPDPEYRILTQDFIYSVVSYYRMDMTGRYSEQMKAKSLSPEVEIISVDDIRSAATVRVSPSSVKTSVKTDYVLRQKENSRLGAAGEEWVLAYEKKRLISIGRKDLAKEVEWVAKDDDSKGYDIHSYDEFGNELLIEVKTTNGSAHTPFYLSALEMAISHAQPSEYRLYRVYDFLKAPKLRIITGDLSLLNPQPTSYIVYFD